VLPGPNVVNLSLMLGDRFFGLRGALVAMAGILTFPLLGVLLLATLYASVQTLPVAQGALRGMGAVAAGLITATGIKLIPALKQNVVGTLVSIGSIAITIIAIAWLRLPLAWMLLGLGGLTCAWAFRQLGRLTAGRAT
jgi:chromate transporter